MKRRLTFKGVDSILADLEKQLYNNIFIPGHRTDLGKQDILNSLIRIREILIYQHNSLFQYLVDNLINKVQVFGLHFASLDIRQESSVHNKVMIDIANRTDALPSNYESLSEAEKINVLVNVRETVNAEDLEEGIICDTIETVHAVQKNPAIQWPGRLQPLYYQSVQQRTECDRGVWPVFTWRLETRIPVY